MRGEWSPLEIFTERTAVPESEPFYIYPDYIGVMYAFGFGNQSRPLPPDGVYGLPGACLNMILWKDTPLPVIQKPTEAGYVDLSAYIGQIMAEELVTTNGCPWQLSACNNLGIIRVSGSYRLVLNDPNDVGIVRVYMRVFDRDSFLNNSEMFFGEKIGE